MMTLKFFQKDANDLVCKYNALSNRSWTNDCLIIKQIDSYPPCLFTEKVSNTVFIKKSTLKVSTMDTQNEDFKPLMKKYEVEDKNDQNFL